MDTKYILAIDQGTTSTRAVLYDFEGAAVTSAQRELPQIFPAIMAGFLLSFTFSFDDFIISFFVAGPNTTLPIYVFSSIRRGITPEVNAIGTIVLAFSLILLVTAQFLLRARNERK